MFIQGSTIPILASICRLPRFAVCQDRDRFTGLYHTHFRDYDPVHSRWLSEDPAGYADGLNLNAAYMGVNGVDPLGLGSLRDSLSDGKLSVGEILDLELTSEEIE